MMKSVLTICELPPKYLSDQFIIRSSRSNSLLKFFPLLSSTQGGINQVNRRRRLLSLLTAAALLCATAAQA